MNKYFILFFFILFCIIHLLSLTNGQKTEKIQNYKEQMKAIYEKNLKNWPIPHKTIFAKTQYGKTHVIISGPENGSPVILLHPFGFNGTIWANTVAELGKSYKTYCLDTIGDMGRSVLKSETNFPQNAEQYCNWLEDVFTFFKIKKAHIIGLSMGGWIGNAMGLYKPEYVKKLVLCAPASGIPEKVEWNKFLEYMILNRTEENLKKMVRLILGNGKAYDKWSDYFFAGLHRFDAKVVPPYPFTDEQLKSIKVPIMLMVGNKEVVWKSIDETLKRGKRLIPSLHTVIIPDAGHALIVDQPKKVNREILQFLNQKK